MGDPSTPHSSPLPRVQKAGGLARASMTTGHVRNPSHGGGNNTGTFKGWKVLNYEPSSVRKVRSTSDFNALQEGDELYKITIGICAMSKKTKSKPMSQILNRLERYGDFETVIFSDAIILDEPVENWPQVDALVAFHSEGFPLLKVKQYVDLRKPYLLNDLEWQFVLLDRRLVYKRLKEVGIPVPKHIVVDRAEPDFADPPGFIETEDYVELNGERIEKPFVEKPASGEDHNIYIYYPHSMGGGVKKLFRKVENKSADYDARHPGTVRRDGAYIYEQFITTGGTDVKVYTIGPRYAHAEARKSPVVDGKVMRSADGKEVRFPVLLSPQEKEMARIVCLAFGQKVCGFDMLRTDKGRSYVCDVNGWSFVKNSTKYYDDCAGILRGIILGALAPQRLSTHPMNLIRGPVKELDMEGTEEEILAGAASPRSDHSSPSLQGVDEEGDDMDELRCVLAVIRHGDRTPKQKVKVRVTQPPLLALLTKHMDAKGKQAKLKSPNQMQELLDVTRDLIKELILHQNSRRDLSAFGAPAPPKEDAGSPKLPHAAPSVATLQLSGHAASLGASSPDLTAPTPPAMPSIDETQELIDKLKIIRAVLEQGGHFSGVNRKAQIKPLRWAAPEEGGGRAPEPVEAMLIVKHGGVLTHAGREQSERLGSQFRTVMYPTHGNPDNGLLRLHSTYRHDLKMYSSDEGRVQTSAAAFLKGLLDLEGASLTPILVSLVKKDAAMLDVFDKGASKDIRTAKAVLYEAMTYDDATGTSYCVPLPSVTDEAPSRNLSPPASPRPAHPLGALHHRHSASSFKSLGLENEEGKGGASQAPSPHPSGRGSFPPARDPAPPTPTPAAFTPTLPALVTPGPERRPSGSLSLSYPPLSPLSKGGDTPAALNPLGAAAAAEGGAEKQSSPLPSSIAAGAGALPPRDPSRRPLPLNVRESSAPLPSDLPSAYLLRTPSRNGSSTAVNLMQSTGDLSMDIARMPDKPLELLFRLRDLLLVHVENLRQLCLSEDRSEEIRGYSALLQDLKEWQQQANHPCGGERLILMYDRWRKLQKAFYNEKKRQFDISKIPDIYDSAKYDSIHNLHLGKELGMVQQMADLYETSKVLASCVVPAEYGISDSQKLKIGGKIAKELLGKLLLDLDRVRQESVELASQEGTVSGVEEDRSLYLTAMAARYDEETIAEPRPSTFTADPPEDAPREGGAGLEDFEADTMHRLCPTYASDIRTPLRHVRTRIYFTSESHIHSLLSVLRFAHLGGRGDKNNLAAVQGVGAYGDGPASVSGVPRGPDGAPVRLVSEAAERIIREETPELDYLSHIVFRMYENKRVPIQDPQRFRLEVMFSPGAAFSPHEVLIPGGDVHTMPVAARIFLNEGEGLTLRDCEGLLAKFASSSSFANFMSQTARPRHVRFKKAVFAVIAVLRLLRMLPLVRGGEGTGAAAQALPRNDREGMRLATVAAERHRLSTLPNFY